MAAIIVEITITYFQADNIFCPETIPKKPKINCIIGIWKAKPVVKISTEIKLKYWSKDQNGSTTSDPYAIKNFSAAGTRKRYEKISPIPNNIPEPSVMGNIMSRSRFVIPGKTYTKIW